MLHSHLQRLPWQLTCLLFATVATALITSSNTVDNTWFAGTLPLKRVETDRQAQIAELVPLTRGAASKTIEGHLFNTNPSTVPNITASEIAFISCNPDDYPGYVDAQRVFESAFGRGNISGVILYSTADDYCKYSPPSNQVMMQDFPVLSMTSKSASATLLGAVDDLPISLKYFVKIQGRGGDNSNNNNNGGGAVGGPYSGQQGGQSPLGPSPSTAVAMIILYSITGIITALFLVIIVTGAIRAHRYPDRYGPRDVLGRPRQSRARGLGRAILETIPIVKFGEKEAPKPTDVELASTADAREPRVSNDASSPTDRAASSTQGIPNSADVAAITAPVLEHEEGIAPAQSAALVTGTGTDSASQDNSLGCSICTEDFEKGQDLRVLPCDHKFHPECVDPWLLNVSGTCPLCRVDLRPVTSNDSSASHDPENLNPPLNPEPDHTAHRHRLAFRDMLSLRYRPNATPQERIYYLRRLRAQRTNRSGENGENGASANEAENDRRRSNRMSVRLSGVFGGRARRERSPTQQGESSRSGADALDTSPPQEVPRAANL